MKKIFSLTIALLFLFANFSILAANHKSVTIYDKMKHTKNLSKFVRMIRAADLVDTFKEAGPFTIFAPTNEAFSKLPKGALQQLYDNKKQLIALIIYHVVPGELSFSDLKDGNIKTANGQDLTIKKDGRTTLVNDAHIVQANIKASNGVIHEIDTLLIRESDQKDR